MKKRQLEAGACQFERPRLFVSTRHRRVLMIGAKRLNFKQPLFFDVPARLAMPIAVHPSWRMDFVIDAISRSGPAQCYRASKASAEPVTSSMSAQSA